MATKEGDPMSEVTREMLLIKSLDNSASVVLSEWTRKWLVMARISIGDGAVLSSICEHADTPQAAVRAYFEALCDVDQSDTEHYLVTREGTDQRRHFRWNGAAFVDQPLPVRS